MKHGFKALMVLAIFVGLMGNALAGEDPRFEIGKCAVAGAGIAVKTTNPGKDFRGNEAVVLTTDLSSKQVLDKFVDALSNGKELDGVRVVGMGYLVKGKAWSVTLMLGAEICSIKISDLEKGAQILIKGKHEAPACEEEPVVPEPGNVK